MPNLFDNYNITQLYIFNEDPSKKILKKLNKDELIDVDDFQFKIVTSVSQQEKDDKLMHLIQYEDKQIGWIELEESMQIFRFPAKHFQVIPEIFQPNELNEKMGIEKDFIAHFQGKLLTIKSQVNYNNEVYYSVFLKNKFHGFHKSEYLDPIIETNINLPVDEIDDDITFYKFSNLTVEIEDIIEIEDIKVISVFNNNKVAKVSINSSLNYWTSLEDLPDFDIPEYKVDMSIETLALNEVMQSINEERTKTKEILKSVLSAKEFVSKKKGSNDKFEISSQIKVEELNEELERYKRDNQDLSKQIDKLQKENKLSSQRLEHQRDYNTRLEAQRDKYKDRMNLVEEKMKKLVDENKKLKK